MRRLPLIALLVLLWVIPAREPGTGPSPASVPPAAFQLESEDRPVETGGASVLLVPLDPDGEAFRLTDPTRGARFDIDGDGAPEMVAWPVAGANVAFLARDTDGDGAITSGRELVGSAAYKDVTNGCSALLRMFERSGAALAGSIQDGHDLYDRLLLWTDRNRNGRSEDSEVIRVRAAFTAIGLGFQRVRWADGQGNRVRYLGWMHARTGGPAQAMAADPQDDARRRRRYFEVVLRTAAVQVPDAR